VSIHPVSKRMERVDTSCLIEDGTCRYVLSHGGWNVSIRPVSWRMERVDTSCLIEDGTCLYVLSKRRWNVSIRPNSDDDENSYSAATVIHN
jgi:hypothetical protein